MTEETTKEGTFIIYCFNNSDMYDDDFSYEEISQLHSILKRHNISERYIIEGTLDTALYQAHHCEYPFWIIFHRLNYREFDLKYKSTDNDFIEDLLYFGYDGVDHLDLGTMLG